MLEISTTAPAVANAPAALSIKGYSPDDLLTPKEHAKVRRCSIRRLEDERAQGRGPAYIKDGYRVFYRWRDIEAYLHENLRHTNPEPRRRGRPRKSAAAPETAQSATP